MSDTANLSERDQWMMLVDLDKDGSLTPSERERLEAKLAAGGPLAESLAEEAGSLKALQSLLEQARVSVHPEFVDRVMAALETRRAAQQRRSFVAVAAVLVALVTATVFLIGLSSAPAEVAETAGGPLGALGDFFVTTLLAGAGLLGASWQGFGTALGRWLGESVLNLIGFAALVIGLNVLFFSLLRRRRAAVRATRSDQG